MHATAFALGIHEDTGSLTYTSTTFRDIEALAACVRLGANQELLARYLRGPLQPEQRELLRRWLASRSEREIAGLRVVTAWPRPSDYVEDVSTLASRVGDVVRLGRARCSSVEMEGRVLLVGRSRTAARRRRRRARAARRRRPRPGGVGDRARHRIAEAVLERVLAEVERVAQPPLRAREVMSRPVHAVPSTRADRGHARRSASASA